MTSTEKEALAERRDPPTTEERLAELEHNIKTWGIIELAVRNPSVAEYMTHWEGRALKAEAAAALRSAPQGETQSGQEQAGSTGTPFSPGAAAGGLHLATSAATGSASDTLPAPLPSDVIELVIAAREAVFGDGDKDAFQRLDKASEAFADRIPWDDEPVAASPLPQAETAALAKRLRDFSGSNRTVRDGIVDHDSITAFLQESAALRLEAADALEAALATPVREPVAIRVNRTLIWESIDSACQWANVKAFWLQYRITLRADGMKTLRVEWLGNKTDELGQFAEWEGARKAAQADFDARLATLSALEPVPERVKEEPVAELIKLITPGNFSHEREIGDVYGWCDRLRAKLSSSVSTLSTELSQAREKIERLRKARDEAQFGFDQALATLERIEARAEATEKHLALAMEALADAYDECADVAVPASSDPFQQVEYYRATIRKLKARAALRAKGEKADG